MISSDIQNSKFSDQFPIEFMCQTLNLLLYQTFYNFATGPFAMLFSMIIAIRCMQFALQSTKYSRQYETHFLVSNLIAIDGVTH